MSTRSKPTLRAAVFREAARLVAEQEESCCCFALDRVMWGTPDNDAHHIFFRTLLKPRGRFGYWYGSTGVWEDEDHQRADMARTIGLLLCAELVKDGWE